MSEADQHAQRIFTQEQMDIYARCVGVLNAQYKPEHLERRKCRLILKMFYGDELSLKRVNETWRALKWLPLPLIIMENIGWLQTFSSFYREANLTDDTHQMVYKFLNDIIHPVANMETKTYSKRSQKAFHVGVAMDTLKFFKTEVNKMTRTMLDEAFELQRLIKDTKQVCINIDNRNYDVKNYGNDLGAMNKAEEKDLNEKRRLDREIRKWNSTLHELKRRLQELM